MGATQHYNLITTPASTAKTLREWRLELAGESNSNMTKIDEAIWNASQTDTTLSESGKSADAKKVGDELTDLKSAIDYPSGWLSWTPGSISYSNGAITSTEGRWHTSLTLNSSVITKIVGENSATFAIAAWNDHVFIGLYKSDGTFAKTNTDTVYVSSFDVSKYSKSYSFTFITGDTANVKLYTTADRLELTKNNGFHNDIWTSGAVNGNPGEEVTIGTTSSQKNKRKYVYVQDLSFVKRITWASGYQGFAKIVNSEKIIVYQTNAYGSDAVIPASLQSAEYGMYVVSCRTDDNTIPITEAAAYTTFFNDSLIQNITYPQYYNGEKITLNAHGYNAYLALRIENISGYHKQGSAVYGDLLVQFYSDNYVQLINVQTGEIINSFTTTTGHGASAQFSTEFYADDDPYPLLYIAPAGDDTTIQVVRLTDDTWSVVRYISCPAHSFVAIDNDTNRLFIGTFDSTGAEHYTGTLTCYNLYFPTIDGNNYSYPLINTAHLADLHIFQCMLIHQGKLFFLSSSSNGVPHGTWIYVIDPYSGSIITIIKDFINALKNDEIEGMAVYYNTRFQKNLLLLVPTGVQAYALDFDV